MVLIRTLGALLAVAGCSQSLFDANGRPRDGGDGGDDGGGGDDGSIPLACPATCLADAAADFDNPSRSTVYLEEGPAHSWLEMSFTGTRWTGTAEPTNLIERCGSAPGCAELSGALVVKPAGDTSQHVPAIEYTSPEAQVLHLIVHASVSNDAEQEIRLYRNGREDVLFDVRLRGARRAAEVIVDALAGDRFVVSVRPTSAVGGTAAIHFFVSNMGERFPRTCQLAASFQAQDTGYIVADLCGTERDLSSLMEPGGTRVPAVLIDMGGPMGGPGRTLGNFTRLQPGSYFQAAGAPLDRSTGSLTTQFWVRVFNSTTSNEVSAAVDDFNHDSGDGSTVGFFGGSNPELQIRADNETGGGSNEASSSLPLFGGGVWRFVRMVDVAGTLKVCVDGSPGTSLPVASDRAATDQPLHVGRRAYVANSALFDGDIDDLRVFSEALPCE